MAWHEQRHPVEMSSEDLEEAKRQLLRWHSHHLAEARRLQQQVAHIDMVIHERFLLPMPDDITPTDAWEIREDDLGDPPVPQPTGGSGE